MKKPVGICLWIVDYTVKFQSVQTVTPVNKIK